MTLIENFISEKHLILKQVRRQLMQIGALITREGHLIGILRLSSNIEVYLFALAT